MAEAFIIMQIGNDALDSACIKAIVPALEAAGLSAKRVDKHNQGGLLQSEIIEFIQRAEVIVADLTNERPNCYLEVGYAMGIDKFRNLILTAREDHYPESPNYIRGGPKVHFDLIGYDILFWDPNDLDHFRIELEKRIRRRLLVISPEPVQAPPIWDYEWIKIQREHASEQWKATGKTGFLEARIALDTPKIYKTQTELDEAARTSEIHTFGWPIGVYLRERNEYRPRPRSDGIFAVVGVPEYGTYDYWAWRCNGDFFLYKTIFEDQRDPSRLFFDTRIVRTTELLLYCARVYTKLEVESSHRVHIAVRHGGLKNRRIGSASARGPMLRERLPAEEDIVETSAISTLGGIETDLVELVKSILSPVFVIFDFFKIDDTHYEKIVNAFVEGRI